MNIQKKKLSAILVKIQNDKSKYIRSKILIFLRQLVNALFIVIFIVVNGNSLFKNRIFEACQLIHLYVLKSAYFLFVARLALLIIVASIIFSLLFLVLLEINIPFKQKRLDFQKALYYFALFFWIVFDWVGILLTIVIILDFQLLEQSILRILMNFLTIILVQTILVFSNLSIIFSNKLVLMLTLSQILGAVPLYCIFMSASIYQLRSLTYESNTQQTYKAQYKVLLAFNFIMLLSEIFQFGISELSIILIISFVLIADYFTLNSQIIIQQIQNDYLLGIFKKLKNQQQLSIQQIKKIKLIFAKFMQGYKYLLSNDQLQKLNQYQIQQTNYLYDLILLKLKISCQKSPTNLHLQIQTFQCQLLHNNFEIKIIYDVYKLHLKVIDKCDYSQCLRMQLLMQQIQAQLLKNQQPSDTQAIIKIENKLQRFYYCIGCAIQQLLDLWSSISDFVISQHIFTNSLTKIIQFQQESMALLKQLQKYKDLQFQKQLTNCLHRIINTDGEDIVSHRSITNKIYDQTKYILVSNNVIKDTSLFIQNQFGKQQSLCGLNINNLLYGFFGNYIEEQTNNLINIANSHKQIIIPLKLINEDKMFIITKATFHILSDIHEGAKFIIRFTNIQHKYQKKYVLYCLQHDNILGFSQSFYQKYKVKQSLLPNIILGEQFFNTDLSILMNNEIIKIGAKINCSLKLMNFRGLKNLRAIKYYSQQFISLVIREIYKVNSYNYLLLQIIDEQNDNIKPSVKQNLDIFVAKSSAELTSNLNPKECRFICKIVNPYETLIDDKLARISSQSRISYYKMIYFATIVILLSILASLLYAKIETQTVSDSFTAQLNAINKSNNFVQLINLLFYQYYQQYQIKNYPDQVLQIYNYNITALNKEYNKKSNANIVAILPYILGNSQSNAPNYTAYFTNFNIVVPADRLTLINFLQNTKEALTSNYPIFMVRNYQETNTIINNLAPSNNDIILNFGNAMLTYFVCLIVFLTVIFAVIKIIYLRISSFKWRVFQIYRQITPKQFDSYKKKLQQLINLLENSYYYKRKQQRKNYSLIYSQNGSSHQFQTKKKMVQGNKQIGVQKQTTIHKIMDRNFIFLPILAIILFFILYNDSIKTLTQQSQSILQYSGQLQAFSLIILQRATQFFQIAMEAIIPLPQRKGWTKKANLFVPTQLTTQLPSFFDEYKMVQQKMLEYNLCNYSYLNTGSLYKNINCSLVLDGIMDKTFAQTYSFLLKNLQLYGGVQISKLGTQFRPNSVYPFFMQVCYSRRTINNMLAYIQTSFISTVSDFLVYKQSKLQSIINAGFIFIPFLIVIIYVFNKQIKEDCNFAIKCFKILPRKFIMKIGISKKLKKNGVLDQIQLVAV